MRKSKDRSNVISDALYNLFNVSDVSAVTSVLEFCAAGAAGSKAYGEDVSLDAFRGAKRTPLKADRLPLQMLLLDQSVVSLQKRIIFNRRFQNLLRFQVPSFGLEA